MTANLPLFSPLSDPCSVCTVAVVLVGFHNFDIDSAYIYLHFHTTIIAVDNILMKILWTSIPTAVRVGANIFKRFLKCEGYISF